LNGSKEKEGGEKEDLQSPTYFDGKTRKGHNCRACKQVNVRGKKKKKKRGLTPGCLDGKRRRKGKKKKKRKGEYSIKKKTPHGLLEKLGEGALQEGEGANPKTWRRK